MMRNSMISFCVILSCLVSASFAKATEPPNTFLTRGDLLLSNKKKIASGDAVLSAALTALQQEADKALNNGPYTVTSKSILPASGDKHDYMSVGPYWWPDKSKPDGLPYIRKDGKVNPERFDIPDADQLKKLTNDVQVLAVTYYYTGKAVYAIKASRLLKTWFLNADTRMNPNLNYGQAIPGITEGRGIGLIDSRAFVEMLDVIPLLSGIPEWKDTDTKALQQWFKAFADWMQESPLGIDESDEHNNHGTFYDCQLIGYGLFTGDTALATQVLKNNSYARIESQLDTDGKQPLELARTRPWNYTTMNLRGFFTIARLAENVHTDLWHYTTPTGKSIRKALVWMLPYGTGQKDFPYKSIEPVNTDGFQQLIRTASQVYPDISSKQWVVDDKKLPPFFLLTERML
ncbi:Alginate lyase [bacterium A37T11]|nr:Alginate lyase [bacterium A37T11]